MTDALDNVVTILRYVLSIQGRDIVIAFANNAITYWDDRTTLPDLIKRSNGNLPRNGILIQIPTALFIKVREFARKQFLEEFGIKKFQISEENKTDNANLDRELIRIFWSEVNPRLEWPLLPYHEN